MTVWRMTRVWNEIPPKKEVPQKRHVANNELNWPRTNLDIIKLIINVFCDNMFLELEGWVSATIEHTKLQIACCMHRHIIRSVMPHNVLSKARMAHVRQSLICSPASLATVQPPPSPTYYVHTHAQHEHSWMEWNRSTEAHSCTCVMLTIMMTLIQWCDCVMMRQ